MFTQNRRTLFLMASMIGGATVVPVVDYTPPPTRKLSSAHKLTPRANFHGERECARRRRQIANGQLTASNGLT